VSAIRISCPAIFAWEVRDGSPTRRTVAEVPHPTTIPRFGHEFIGAAL